MFPNSGPGLKIAEESFIKTIKETKWPNPSSRGASKGAQDKMMTIA